ncbi:MAG: DUF3604 domain-containing protein [Phycisphaerae bacterium]
MKKNISKINWWNVSTIVMLAALGVGSALLISQDACADIAKSNTKATYLAPFKNEEESVEKGETIGVGSARLEGPKTAEVFTYQTWTIVYTAGKVGIKPGGGIRIGIRHMCHLWSTVQEDDPKLPGYLTVKSTDNVPVSISVECRNWSKRFSGQYFPWQNIVEVVVGKDGMKPGQTIRVTYGDKTEDSPGFQVQPFDESHFIFKVYVDALGNNEYLPLAESPAVKIAAGRPNKLTALIPSNAVVGKTTWCVIRAEDHFGNTATRYNGTISFKATDTLAKLPCSYTFTQADKGVHRFENIIFNTKGYHTISVEDGKFYDESNPVKITQNHIEKLLLWGDLHGHTLHSDGRGTVEEYYDFAERVTALDFCAVSDHAFEMLDDMWSHSKTVTNQANKPGKFVTINAYEWSGASNVGGDHNVYLLEDDPPLYRSGTGYNKLNLQVYHGPEPKVEHIKDLFAKLEQQGTNKKVFCIPHRGGRAGNFKWHNPKVQRLIEIFSEHFRSESWATEFLKKGHRLGIMASTDNHYGNPGYGYLKRGQSDYSVFRKQEIGMGLIAVFAKERTRKSIFTALYDRHCYATSGDRIILELTADGYPMGSEYRTSEPPLIAVSAAGTADINRVEIKKNSSIVYVNRPNKRIIKLNWRDPDFDSSKATYYYMRIVQANNEEAISSPIWVN